MGTEPKENPVSAEFWAIIGVGVAVVGLHWRMYDSLSKRLDVVQADMANMKERLAAVEATLALLVKGLHVEVSGKGGNP